MKTRKNVDTAEEKAKVLNTFFTSVPGPRNIGKAWSTEYVPMGEEDQGRKHLSKWTLMEHSQVMKELHVSLQGHCQQSSNSHD